MLTMDKFTAVKKLLFDARNKWEEIGEELGLRREDLRHISGNDDNKKLGEMLEKWLQRSQLNPTWQNLANALRQPQVDRGDIADKIVKEGGAE